MITCPTCGRTYENTREVCDCGEYLGWQRGAPGAAALAGSATVLDPPPQIGQDSVILSLHLPEQEPGGPVHVDVTAGGRTTLSARVRNQSGIVDNYDLGIEGLPDGWWTITPRTLYLLPLGTEGTYESEVEVAIHPPLSPDAEAREWVFDVTAVSRAGDCEVGRVQASVTIAPYARIDMAIRPQRVRGRRRGRLAVAIQNRGNASSALTLSAVDSDDACRFAIPESRPVLARGQGIVSPIVVRPRRPILIGRPLDRGVEFLVRGGGLDAEPIRGTATFVQRPWLPWWVGVLIPLLIAALLALLLLRPDKVTVPDLSEEKSVVMAQNTLEDAKLELDPQIQRRRTSNKLAGAILAQSPAAGKEVKEGDTVTIEVGVGSNRRKIPNLVKLKAAKAEAELTRTGFTVGATSPELNPAFVVSAQIPEAGAMRARGTPVNLFLKPVPKKKRKSKAAAGGAAAGAGASGGGAAGLVVPEVLSKPISDATGLLRKAGLTRGAVDRVINTARRGTVLRSNPRQGKPAKPGQKIPLVVSAGFPRLAFGDGTRVLTAGGATGAAPQAIATDVPSRQPAWTFDAARLAYVADGRIFLVDPAEKDDTPTPLTPADGPNYARPSFAPTRSRRAMAFLRAREGDGDLCLARVRGSRASAPSCVGDTTIDLNGPPAWSPRGTEILVPGVVPGTSGARFGLVRYRSATPFSARASDWSEGRVVTDLARPGRGVIRAAYSPDGRRVALVSNLRGRTFRVVIAKRTDLVLKEADVLPLAACDVAWRPDGRQLLVVVADPLCTQRTGVMARVDPTRPTQLAAVRMLAADPAWQPVDLE